jgi:hypothetical protein
VTKPGGCDAAARAADAIWVRAKLSAHDAHRRVYLFNFGDFFVVADPNPGKGEPLILSSFSSAWAFLGTLRL